MANEEHLEILRKGVEEWNRWREEYPKVQLNLVDADLRMASLSGADLSSGSWPLGDGFNYELFTNLSHADLSDADLSHADLSGADLRLARLNGSDLRHANLRATYLGQASFESARLEGAWVDGAILGRTVFARVDLRQVKGLESMHHLGPSTLGTNTLERSRGQIPEAFLKGCGLSDWEIEAAKLYNPDLDEDERTTIWYEIERIRGRQPWALSRVFFSYTRDDEPFVEALERLFDEKGVRYWRDVHHLKAGRLDRQIDRAITLYPLVLLVLSERSVLSDWVEWEAAKAREIEREHAKAGEPRDVLCPVALDDAWESCDWPGPLRRQIKDFNVLDFSGWENDTAKMDRQFTKLYEGMVLNYGRKNERSDGEA